MKVYNPHSDRIIHTEIETLLINYRNSKNFNAKDYIHAKSILLNSYMHKFNLKSCVIAVSGGIDSAIVLGIVAYAAKLNNSPIKKILPVCLPVSDSKGATGQDTATIRGKEVCLSYGIQPFVIELSPPHKLIGNTVSENIHITGEDWAQGQLVAHTRTPTLYYCATLLTQEKLPAIICGTTNRDEGLYLGYFGKASDGLVDVQLISDLHKSEVYKVAQELNTPDSILKVTPQGDMYDGRSDEEVFGAPYAFVEYYLHFLSLSLDEQQLIKNLFSQEAAEQFDFFSQNIENLHNYNRHKYFGASPAVHLDLDYKDIKEGWKTNCSFSRKSDKAINIHNFVGLTSSDSVPMSFTNPIDSHCVTHYVNNNPIYCINNAFSNEENEWLLKQCNHNDWKPANIYGKHEISPDFIMSQRTTIYNDILSNYLFQRIAKHIPHLKIHEDITTLPRMLNNSNIWSASSINPLFRYIRYNNGQQLITHYDDTYEYNEYKKTLMTVIIYLEDSSALTRFINDPQTNIEESKRNYNDWSNIAEDKHVLLSIPSKIGQIVVFDHRILHDATAPYNEQKTIIRTDLVFEAPQLGFDL